MLVPKSERALGTLLTVAAVVMIGFILLAIILWPTPQRVPRTKPIDCCARQKMEQQ